MTSHDTSRNIVVRAAVGYSAQNSFAGAEDERIAFTLYASKVSSRIWTFRIYRRTVAEE